MWSFLELAVNLFTALFSAENYKKRWVQGLIVVVVGVALLLVLSGCSQASAPMFLSGGGAAHFLESEFELLRQALAGDSAAALALSTGYGVYLRDHQRSETWLQKAADLGSLEARHQLNILAEQADGGNQIQR